MTVWRTLSPKEVLAVILGGGAGTRLFPLTKDRAKPAVPLGGKYRIVDIPISNCLNADLRRICLLTQFNSSSLHRHIQDSYRFDTFSPGFVEILAAQQRTDREQWYQGTADAVRQNLLHLNDYPHQLVLILSGDQLYRMDFRALVEQHIATGAEATVATIPVDRQAASAFGIMQVANDRRITRFVEKPKDPALLESLRPDWSAVDLPGDPVEPGSLLASMGIYVFNRDVLGEALAGTEVEKMARTVGQVDDLVPIVDDQRRRRIVLEQPLMQLAERHHAAAAHGGHVVRIALRLDRRQRGQHEQDRERARQQAEGEHRPFHRISFPGAEGVPVPGPGA